MSTEDPAIRQADPAVDPVDPTDPSPSGWGRVQVVVVGMLVVALVAALVCIGLLWRAQQRSDALVAAGVEAEAAATNAAVRMTSYDHDTVDDDFAWVQDAGTADFQTYFADISQPAIELIKQLGADATGSVVDSAVRVEDTEHATVLMFVDQQITTTVATPVPAAPSVDQPRVTMSMVRDVDGAWLVDAVAINNLAPAG